MSSARGRLLTLAAVGAFGGAVPYLARPLGLEVNVASVVEVVDHVLPAVVIVVVALLGLVRGRLGLPGAVLTFLAGLWMAGTHLPLLLQVPRNEVEPAPALFHSVPGLVLLGLGLLALTRWTAEEERAAAAAERPAA